MSNIPTVESLEELWESGQRPDLSQFVGDAPVSRSLLFGLIAEDMRRSRTSGRPNPTEYYFERFTRLDSEQRLDIIYHEFLLREEAGDDPELAEYQRRFPKQAEAIARQLALHLALDASIPPEPAFATLRDFELLQEIGSGGMGKVYRAHHSRLHRTVAIKVLHPNQFRDADAVLRFEREMQAIGQLMHPNIVQAMDAGEENGRHYLALEYVDGADAHQLVRTYGQLAVADACEIVRQAALGLEHAHVLKLIHRDIKPSNLLISKTGVVKVADLGLALLHQSTNVRSDLTATGQILGTLDYIAPEQIENMHSVDARADLYSLGCTLYQLLTGRAPFALSQFSSVLKKLRAHEQVTPEPVGTARDGAGVPPQLQEVVHQLLAKNPAERIQTAGELAVLLGRFTVGSQLAELVIHQQANQDLLDGTNAPEDADTLVEVTPTAETIPQYPSQYPRTPDSTAISDQLRKRSDVRKSSTRWLVLGGLIALGILGAIFMVQFRAATSGTGTIVVDTGGSKALVTISQQVNGTTNLIVEQSDQRSFEIPAGTDYRVLVEEPSTDIRFKTSPFSINSGASTKLNLATQLDEVRQRLARLSPQPEPEALTPLASDSIEPDPTGGVDLSILSPAELEQFFGWAVSVGLLSPESLTDESGQIKTRLNLRLNSSEFSGQLISRISSSARIFVIYIGGDRLPNKETMAAIADAKISGLQMTCPIDDAGVAMLPSTIHTHLHLTEHLGPTNRTVELIASQLNQLAILSLPDVTKVSDDRFSLLSDLRIVSLGLKAGVTDEHMKQIARYPRLKHLRVGGTELTDKCFAHLRSLQTLQTVSLDAPNITKAAIEEFLEARPDCRVISP